MVGQIAFFLCESALLKVGFQGYYSEIFFRCRRYSDREHRDDKLHRRQLSLAIYERDYFLFCILELQRLCRPREFPSLFLPRPPT